MNEDKSTKQIKHISRVAVTNTKYTDHNHQQREVHNLNTDHTEETEQMYSTEKKGIPEKNNTMELPHTNSKLQTYRQLL